MVHCKNHILMEAGLGYSRVQLRCRSRENFPFWIEL